MHVDFTTKIFPIIWREAFLPGSRSYYSDFLHKVGGDKKKQERQCVFWKSGFRSKSWAEQTIFKKWSVLHLVLYEPNKIRTKRYKTAKRFPNKEILINYLLNNERCERKIYIYRISLRCHRRTIPSIAAPRLYTQIRGVRKLKGTLHGNIWVMSIGIEGWSVHGSMLFALNTAWICRGGFQKASSYISFVQFLAWAKVSRSSVSF